MQYANEKHIKLQKLPQKSAAGCCAVTNLVSAISGSTKTLIRNLVQQTLKHI